MHASASTRRACSPQAVQDRLVANGGALGEWAPGPASGPISKGPASYCRSATPMSGRAATISSARRRLRPRAPAWATTSTGRADHRRRRLALRQQHRRGRRRDLCGDLRELQGRLEHQCELVSGRGLRRLGRRALVCLGKRGRELQRFRHLAASHALRPSGRRHLLTLGPELSGPRRGGLPLGASGRRRECFRHALRRVGLRECPYRRASPRRAASARFR